MKITDAILSMLIKKGVIFEGKNFDVDFEIDGTKVNVKAEHIVIRTNKEEKA